MIRTIAIACLIALPAAAQQMTPDTCRDAWQAFNRMTDQRERLINVTPDVTDQGWCRVDRSNAELKPQDFASLEFRGTGIPAAVENQGAPESLDVRIDGIDLVRGWKLPIADEYGGPRGTARLEYLRDPQSRAITVSHLDAGFGAFGHIKIKAQGGGIDLSSLKSMQYTLGGARLYDLTVQFQTTPVLSAALLSDLPRPLSKEAIQAIPDSSIDADSRAALLALLAAKEEATGLLRVHLRSDTGIGVLQITGGLMPLEFKDKADITAATLAEPMEILLTGVTISAEWIGVE